MWKPFFASGKLVRDYEPLRRYLEKVKGSEWYEKAFLSEQDFKKLKEVAKNLEVKKLGPLWDELTKIMKERVDAKAAYEALRECGYRVKDEEEAREKMAEILAGWLIEAGEEWNVVKFKDVGHEGSSAR